MSEFLKFQDYICHIRNGGSFTLCVIDERYTWSYLVDVFRAGDRCEWVGRGSTWDSWKRISREAQNEFARTKVFSDWPNRTGRFFEVFSSGKIWAMGCVSTLYICPLCFFQKTETSDSTQKAINEIRRRYGYNATRDGDLLRLLEGAFAGIDLPLMKKRFCESCNLTGDYAALLMAGADLTTIQKPEMTGKIPRREFPGVYAFVSSGFIKIGKSKNVVNRLLQWGSIIPTKVHVLGAWASDDPGSLESNMISALFPLSAFGNEWFHRNPYVEEFLSQCKDIELEIMTLSRLAGDFRSKKNFPPVSISDPENFMLQPNLSGCSFIK